MRQSLPEVYVLVYGTQNTGREPTLDLDGRSADSVKNPNDMMRQCFRKSEIALSLPPTASTG